MTSVRTTPAAEAEAADAHGSANPPHAGAVGQSGLCDVARTAGLFDESVVPDLVLGDGALTTKGTWVRVGKETSQPWNPVIADLGFTPTVWVRFQLGRSSDYPDQQDDMVRLVSGLLDRTPGDAVLNSSPKPSGCYVGVLM
ncbi:MAG TPA: SitI3 family protein [Streptomyces sp.]